MQVNSTTGAVTILGPGQAVITAVKAGDDVYNLKTTSVVIDVGKAIPTIAVAPTASAIQSGSPLSASTLTGGAVTGLGSTVLTGVFVWSNSSNVVSTSGNYEVTFIPDNSADYATAAVMVPLSVTPKSSGSNSRNTTVIKQIGMNPGRPVIAELEVIPSSDENGHATAAVNERSVADAVAKALAEAKSTGQLENGIGISINIIPSETAKSFDLVLPQAALNSLVDAGVRQLEINGDIINLRFDLEAVKELRNQSTGNVTITAKPAEYISDEVKKLIEGRPVYDLTLTYEQDGKTAAINSLKQGSATLSIPYQPNKNEAVGHLFGVYMDGTGQAIRIPGSAYDSGSGSIILRSNHFSVYGVGYSEPSKKYTDITTHWARESIDYVVGRGLFGGTGETAFSPDKPMDRGMLVTVLGRLAGADVSAHKTSSFADVAAGKYYLPYVEWAYRMGIVRGVGDGRFDPKRPVTRQEFAAILQNYARVFGVTLPVTHDAADIFEDSNSIGSGYLTAVNTMQQAGIMMGSSGNRFKPKAGATRAEVAVMLKRYIKLTVD